jgi:hypothetical protein
LSEGTRCFDLRANAIGEKLHGLAEQFPQLLGDWFQSELFHSLSVGPSQVAHQHQRGPLVKDVLDRRQGRGNACRIGNRSGFLVLRNVKVHSHDDATSAQRDIGNRLFHSEIRAANF